VIGINRRASRHLSDKQVSAPHGGGRPPKINGPINQLGNQLTNWTHLQPAGHVAAKRVARRADRGVQRASVGVKRCRSGGQAVERSPVTTPWDEQEAAEEARRSRFRVAEKKWTPPPASADAVMRGLTTR